MKLTPYMILAMGLASFSCASTPSPVQETLEPVPADEIIDLAPAVPEEPVQEAPDPAQLAFQSYQEQVGDVSLSLLSSPKETLSRRAFSAPFVVKAARSDGSPVAGLELSVSYPASRAEDGSIVFGSAAVTTAEDGTAIWAAGTPDAAFSSFVSFAPALNGDLSENGQAVALTRSKAVEAPFKVRTRFMQAGGSLAIVDFSASGAPIRSRSDSSSALLMSLMQKGFVRIGNADFTDQVASGSREAVYKAAKSLFGSSSAYLIFGTVKYASPVQKTEAGYSCTLLADITCLDMKDGSVLYRTEIEETAVEKQEWSALTQARSAIAKKLSEQIYYGM